MKKTLIITFVDGSKIEKDLMKEAAQFPVGTQANSMAYANLCEYIGSHGWIEEGNEKYLKVIPPSQIKSVEVVFGEGKTVMNIITPN